MRRLPKAVARCLISVLLAGTAFAYLASPACMYRGESTVGPTSHWDEAKRGNVVEPARTVFCSSFTQVNGTRSLWYPALVLSITIVALLGTLTRIRTIAWFAAGMTVAAAGLSMAIGLLFFPVAGFAIAGAALIEPREHRSPATIAG